MKHRHKGPKVKYRRKGKTNYRKRPLHKKTLKGYVVYKRRPKHGHLSKEHRSIFQRLDRKPYETGGYMDFNRKGLERADIYIGRKGSVDIPIDPDEEVDYHIHQKDKDKRLNRINQFPSKWDIKTSKDYPTQSSLIMHDGKIMMASKTPEFKVNKKLLNKIDRNLSKDAHKLSTDELYKRYKPEYSKMGLDLKYIKHNKAIRIPIKIVEPKRKRKLTKEGWIYPIEEDPIEKGYTKEGKYLFQRNGE